MIFTDTHTHIYSEAFEEDQATVMQRAFANGLARFFVPAIDASYTAEMKRVKEAYPDKVFLMAGLHPTHVKENYKAELNHVATELDTYNYVAVGEIGIDLYWDKSTLGIQQEAFRYQIQLAKKHNLPIVIHCRDAFDAVFEILEEEKGEDLYGIFHCFTGTHEQALKAIGYNLKLGIGGVVTFKNGKIDKFLGQIDLKHIVLETDAPYLAPTPFRGKRNEPSYLIKVAEKLAEIYDLPLSEIALQTTANSKQVFGI